MLRLDWIVAAIALCVICAMGYHLWPRGVDTPPADNLVQAILECRSGSEDNCRLVANTLIALNRPVSLCAMWEGGEHCIEVQP